MKVALFSDTFYPEINGVATSVFTLQKELEKNGHKVYIVTTNPVEKKTELQGNVLRIKGKKLKKIYGYRLASIYHRKAMAIVKSWNLDLIHVHTEFGIGIFAKIVSYFLKLPLVYTYHTMVEDYAYYITGDKFEYVVKKLVGELSKYYSDSCTELIAPSEKTKIALKRYGATQYVNVIPTGINLEKFSSEKQDFKKIEELKKQYQLESTLNIIYLGRVAKEKNIELILSGFQYFLNHYDYNVKLLIVGSGPNLDELKEIVQSSGISDHVIFFGKVPPSEVSTYYYLGDIFCSASTSETQGLTFIEAMAAQKIVLAKYDKNLDGVIKDGKNGFFFEKDEDFANILNKMANDLTKEQIQEMKKNALLTAEEYSSETFYKKVMVVYERAIRKKW